MDYALIGILVGLVIVIAVIYKLTKSTDIKEKINDSSDSSSDCPCNDENTNPEVK